MMISHVVPMNYKIPLNYQEDFEIPYGMIFLINSPRYFEMINKHLSTWFPNIINRTLCAAWEKHSVYHVKQ